MNRPTPDQVEREVRETCAAALAWQPGLFETTRSLIWRLPFADAPDLCPGMMHAVGGLLAKAGKLARSVHVLAIHGEGEAAMILCRGMAETWMYLAFLTVPEFQVARTSMHGKPYPPQGTDWTRAFRMQLYLARVEAAQAHYVERLREAPGYEDMFKDNEKAISDLRERQRTELGEEWAEIIWKGGGTCIGVPVRELLEAVLSPVDSLTRLVYPKTSVFVHAHDLLSYAPSLAGSGPLAFNTGPSLAEVERALNTANTLLLGACDRVEVNLGVRGLDLGRFRKMQEDEVRRRRSRRPNSNADDNSANG